MRRIVLLVLLTALAASCGPSAREKALSVTLASLNGAREGFVSYDALAQERIVDQAQTFDEGQTALTKHRAKREPVVAAFTVAYATLALAAIEPKSDHLPEALVAAKAVYDAVKAFRAVCEAAVPPAEPPTTPAAPATPAPDGGTP